MDNAIVFCSDVVGAETLEFLIESGERIDLVVITRETPQIDKLVAEHGIAHVDLHTTSAGLKDLQHRRFRWLLNLWGTVVLPKEVLGIAERRINIHPGKVPETRGSDCATWVIRHGIPAGVSLLEMSAEVDAGDVYATQAVEVPFPTSGRQLAERLKQACIELFKREWPDIRDGRTQPVAQSGRPQSFTRADTVNDRLRDLDRDRVTDDVVRWMLAHDFAPDSVPMVRRDGKIYAVRLQLEVVDT